MVEEICFSPRLPILSEGVRKGLTIHSRNAGGKEHRGRGATTSASGQGQLGKQRDPDTRARGSGGGRLTDGEEGADRKRSNTPNTGGEGNRNRENPSSTLKLKARKVGVVNSVARERRGEVKKEPPKQEGGG